MLYSIWTLIISDAEIIIHFIQATITWIRDFLPKAKNLLKSSIYLDSS